jgi:hypothetical protein
MQKRKQENNNNIIRTPRRDHKMSYSRFLEKILEYKHIVLRHLTHIPGDLFADVQNARGATGFVQHEERFALLASASLAVIV